MIELSLRNRQKDRAVNVPMLRRLVRSLLREAFNSPEAQLCVHLISADEMAKVNQHYLNHEGSTDVITFNHAEDDSSGEIYGELFISVADAVKQGREFKATWQSELVRYVVHGILHLRGYDDIDPADRKIMKNEENRIMWELESRRDLTRLEKRIN